MSSTVERLRADAADCDRAYIPDTPALLREAADLIEQQTAQLRETRALLREAVGLLRQVRSWAEAHAEPHQLEVLDAFLAKAGL